MKSNSYIFFFIPYFHSVSPLSTQWQDVKVKSHFFSHGTSIKWAWGEGVMQITGVNSKIIFWWKTSTAQNQSELTELFVLVTLLQTLLYDRITWIRYEESFKQNLTLWQIFVQCKIDYPLSWEKTNRRYMKKKNRCFIQCVAYRKYVWWFCCFGTLLIRYSSV